MGAVVVALHNQIDGEAPLPPLNILATLALLKSALSNIRIIYKKLEFCGLQCHELLLQWPVVPLILFR